MQIQEMPQRSELKNLAVLPAFYVDGEVRTQTRYCLQRQRFGLSVDLPGLTMRLAITADHARFLRDMLQDHIAELDREMGVQSDSSPLTPISALAVPSGEVRT